jgi:hypothetical protein
MLEERCEFLAALHGAHVVREILQDDASVISLAEKGFVDALGRALDQGR